MVNDYVMPQKAQLTQIKTENITKPLPDLKNIETSKAVAIGMWLSEWIKEDLDAKKIQISNLLPSKAELALMLGVSVGTIQNALRYLEDLGCIESKQCIGTMIKAQNELPKVRKLTSKREIAVLEIKKFIKLNKFKPGENLPSSRTIAKAIGCSPNTTRLALSNICASGIVEHKFKNSNDAGWVLKTLKFKTDKSEASHKTLVAKVENDLKEYINENLQIGSKLPAHAELSDKLKVSIKTIHDALKSLTDEGILLPRRGRYGTSVIKMPYDKTNTKAETSIFASAKDTAFYYYEKTQNHIKRMIAENYEIGAKLPSIMALSKEMDLSPNTIRKAFQNLAQEGYLTFSRGRYGGTFVIDIPETASQTFKWLAVNPKYAQNYQN